MRTVCCLDEPPYVACVAYLNVVYGAEMNCIPKTKITLEDYGTDAIYFGVYWETAHTQHQHVYAGKQTLLEFLEMVLEKPLERDWRYDVLAAMANREAEANAQNQGILSGVKILYLLHDARMHATSISDISTLDAFRWYFTGVTQGSVSYAPCLLSAIEEAGTIISKHIEDEATAAVSQYSFTRRLITEENVSLERVTNNAEGPNTWDMKVTGGALMACVVTDLYVNAHHEALHKRHENAVVTCVIRLPDKRAFYSLRSWHDSFNVLEFAQQNELNPGGTPHAAGGNDDRSFFAKLSQ